MPARSMTLISLKPVSMRYVSIRPSHWTMRARCRGMDRCRAISIRQHWSPADRRLTKPLPASSQRRRLPMSSGWYSWCVGEHDANGGGAVQPGRSGFPGGGQTVPFQPVPRPGDHRLAQAAALAATLGDGYRVFIAMRYWQPRAAAAAAEVKAWQPDEIVLLPLYPQFSGTTTASSFAEWHTAAAKIGLRVTERIVCCYPSEHGFAAAAGRGIVAQLANVPAGAKVRVLLSAHGLPLRALNRGDPYQWQVEATAAAVRAAVRRPELDMRVCYQSRVGPLKWLTPSTEHEIRQAGAEGFGLVVAPIAFVSEHSETLVELDRDYRKLARDAGVPFYHRA